MKKFAALLISVCAGIWAVAQSSPSFTFGPRFAAGSSSFVGPSDMFMPGLGLEASVAAKWQWKHVGILFSPTTLMYSGAVGMDEPAYDQRGIRRVYTYLDRYQIFCVTFPAHLGTSFEKGKFGYRAFAGGGPGCTIGGTHTKRYDDPSYNATNGYVGHAMGDLKQRYWLFSAGIGVDRTFKKGTIGLDLRFVRTGAIASLEGVRFSTRAVTLGVSWMRS